MFTGVGASRVRDMFQQARKNVSASLGFCWLQGRKGCLWVDRCAACCPAFVLRSHPML